MAGVCRGKSRGAGWGNVHIVIDDHSRFAHTTVWPDKTDAWTSEAKRYSPIMAPVISRIGLPRSVAGKLAPLARGAMDSGGVTRRGYTRANDNADRRATHLPFLLHDYTSIDPCQLAAQTTDQPPAASREQCGEFTHLAMVVTTMVLSLFQRHTLADFEETLLARFRTMLPALVIMVLAWTICTVTGAMDTGDHVISATHDWLSPALLPVLIFAIGMVISFATGSSWGAMAILTPVAVPLAHHIGDMTLVHMASGAIFSVRSSVTTVRRFPTPP